MVYEAARKENRTSEWAYAILKGLKYPAFLLVFLFFFESAGFCQLTTADILGTVTDATGASYYPLRLEDPKAVYLTKGQFNVKGDGSADDSAAIQAAIDKVEDEHGEGIVFVPEGRYRITRTIYVWPGVRVIGYGTNRPVFVLTDNTSGYQQGIGYMFFFTGGRPGGSHFREWQQDGLRPVVMEGTVPSSNTVIDANPGTFIPR